MAEEACSKQCAKWAWEYLGYCLCNTKDGVSLGLGLISVITWGVAEIPQIITNYKSKSTEGISLAFLLTWIIGDFLNLFGCWLEPATLPTQFYMALFYTVTTLILGLQTIYYGHIYPQLKANKQFHKGTASQTKHVGERSDDSTNSGELHKHGQHISKSDVFQNGIATSSPIPFSAALPPCHSSEQNSYYRSARSLSKSNTPRNSFIAPWRAHSSEDAVHSAEEPLLSKSSPTESVHLSTTKNLFCVVSALTFVLGTMNISSAENSRVGLVIERSSKIIPGHVHRKLMQVNGQQQITSETGGYGGIGTYMGWGMAAIYVGGRFPQILLNIRRGSAEGLSPFMFIFALLGNSTYVASILVNSLDWQKIRPNLPWLLDAAGCALLDTFILLQFTYFAYWRFKHTVSE